MKKFICLLSIFFLFISCKKTNNKSDSITKSIDYSQLNSFIQDSLSDFKILNKNYNQVFELWDDIKIISSTSDVILGDPRTLIFSLESFKLEVEKINDKQLPGKLNVPPIIGRFRVYKTNVLKINSNNINLENIDLFKNNIADIVISYNALIKMMNKIAKESLESNKLDFTVEVE
jgi:hypothetical protein|tara:strand:- start:6088 stop:6612 length:525 start_codon:yes stop_codon:yes gene_type:complete